MRSCLSSRPGPEDLVFAAFFCALVTRLLPSNMGESRRVTCMKSLVGVGSSDLDRELPAFIQAKPTDNWSLQAKISLAYVRDYSLTSTFVGRITNSNSDAEHAYILYDSERNFRFFSARGYLARLLALELHEAAQHLLQHQPAAALRRGCGNLTQIILQSVSVDLMGV